MSHWNHRVTVTRTDDGPSYQVREVYYNKDGTVGGWTVEAIAPWGDTPLELQADLDRFSAAFDRPILDITDESNPREVSS